MLSNVEKYSRHPLMEKSRQLKSIFNESPSFFCGENCFLNLTLKDYEAIKDEDILYSKLIVAVIKLVIKYISFT